jgi:hypothetical protein
MGVVFKEETQSIMVEVGYLCNSCGKQSLKEDLNSLEWMEASDNNHLISIIGKSFTTFPDRLSKLKFVLCSDCLKNLVSTFKVEPEINYLDLEKL